MSSISIFKATFPITAPYAAGHVLNEAEAKSLNQTRRENIGNGVRKQLEKLKGEAEELAGEALVAATELVAKYDAAYVFAARNVVARIVDPLEKEVMSLARAQLTTMLKKQNKKLTDVEKAKPEAVAAKLAEIAKNPVIIKLAKDRLKQREAMASELDLGDLGADEPAAEPDH
jgi:hypothetical protein